MKLMLVKKIFFMLDFEEKNDRLVKYQKTKLGFFWDAPILFIIQIIMNILIILFLILSTYLIKLPISL